MSKDIEGRSLTDCWDRRACQELTEHLMAHGLAIGLTTIR